MGESSRTHGALRESDLRRFLEASPDIFFRFELTPTPRFSYLSPAATALTGYRADQLYAGLDDVLSFVHEADRERVRATFLGQVAAGEELIRVQHASGRIVWFEPRFVEVRDAAGRLEALEGIARDVTDQRRAEEAAHAAAAALAEHQRRLALLQQRERIAMDLHDGAIQQLYAVSLALTTHLRAHPHAYPATRTVLSRAASQLDGVIGDIRRYVASLRPPLLEHEGLEAGLREIVDEMRSRPGSGPSVSLEADRAALAVARRVPARASRELVLIAQEALSNAVRHAHASTITVSLRAVRGRVQLQIYDDGRGFDPRSRGRRVGDGLRNMAERSRAIGARLRIRSAPGAGTHVLVSYAPTSPAAT